MAVKTKRIPKARAAQQPFKYPLERKFVEPDWTRLPGYKDVTTKEWESALWQRQHSVKNLKELKAAFGPFLTDELAADLEKDQRERATMSILITPHMLNTMNEHDLRADPGETTDVAAQHPEVVARLDKAFEAWWQEILPCLVNEDAYKTAPAVNPFKAHYWKQFNGPGPNPTPPPA